MNDKMLTRDAVRFLHVEKGLTLPQCAKQLGITTSAAHNAMRRVYEAMARENGPTFTDRPQLAPLRAPCLRCGTRYDKHDAFGCKKWIGG